MQEALDAALAVGDFDAGNRAITALPSSAQRPGTAASRRGDKSSCSKYLNPDPADGGAAPQ